MATLATETWTGTTGAAWPAQWTITAGGTGSSATIQSNAGRLTYPTTSGYTEGVAAYLSGMSTIGDFDLTVTVTFSVITERYVAITGRADSAGFFNGYGINIFPANGTTTCNLFRSDGTGGTSLTADLAAGAWTAGVARNVRVQMIGTTLRCKVWDAAGSEPATWLGTATDSTYTGTGKVTIATQTGNTTSGGFVTFDDLTVTDGTTAVTVAGALSGSGTLSQTHSQTLTTSAALSASGTLGATSTPLAVRSVSLTGSGALTATAVQVVSAALSGSGTLGATWGATTVAANLSGTGTLSATRASISVGAPLTGAGALSAAVVVAAYRVTLSATGTLSASTIAILPGPLFSSGRLEATTQRRVYAWVFRTPTIPVRVRMAGRGLLSVYDQGLTVYRVGGQWLTRLSPGANELAAADRVYQGGYLHRLSDAQRAELTGAFPNSITYEEVPA